MPTRRSSNIAPHRDHAFFCLKQDFPLITTENINSSNSDISSGIFKIKAGAASMASAWFIHWPVRPVWPARGLYGPVPIGNYSPISLLTRCCGRALSHWWSLVFQHNLHTKSIQQSSFSRPIRLHFISPQSFVRNCLFIIYIFIAWIIPKLTSTGVTALNFTTWRTLNAYAYSTQLN